jgi:TRAP-type C4-dicarboxylate transport system permease small subunit
MKRRRIGVPAALAQQVQSEPAPGPAGRGFSFEHVVLNVGFIVVTSAIVWGVLSRYVTAQPATWVQEVTSIAFAWVVFVGAAEVHRAGKHVSVNILTAFLPTRLQKVLAVASEIFVALYCFYAAWLSLQQTIASNSAYTPMLDIPLSVPFAGLTVGFLLMGLRGLQRLPRHLRQSGA